MIEPESPDFSSNKVHTYLRVSPLSAPPGSRIHNCAPVALTDLHLLDVALRLLNLQLGLREVSVDKTPSPWDRSREDRIVDWKDAPTTDFTALATLNHTVHFHDLDSEATPGHRADQWVFSEDALVGLLEVG